MTDIGRKRMKGVCARMGKFVDLTGRKFGALTVVSRAKNNKHNQTMWNCLCECGTEISVLSSALKGGEAKSCGCQRGLRISQAKIKHGYRARGRKERLYDVWVCMRERCTNAHQKVYPYYGGRGIKVCQEWNDYEVFREWALANGYDKDAPRGKCTLDRIDSNGNYEPSNCRWVDMSTQRKNQRRMVKL